MRAKFSKKSKLKKEKLVNTAAASVENSAQDNKLERTESPARPSGKPTKKAKRRVPRIAEGIKDSEEAIQASKASVLTAPKNKVKSKSVSKKFHDSTEILKSEEFPAAVVAEKIAPQSQRIASLSKQLKNLEDEFSAVGDEITQNYEILLLNRRLRNESRRESPLKDLFQQHLNFFQQAKSLMNTRAIPTTSRVEDSQDLEKLSIKVAALRADLASLRAINQELKDNGVKISEALSSVPTNKPKKVKRRTPIIEDHVSVPSQSKSHPLSKLGIDKKVPRQNWDNSKPLFSNDEAFPVVEVPIQSDNQTKDIKTEISTLETEALSKQLKKLEDDISAMADEITQNYQVFIRNLQLREEPPIKELLKKHLYYFDLAQEIIHSAADTATVANSQDRKKLLVEIAGSLAKINDDLKENGIKLSAAINSISDDIDAQDSEIKVKWIPLKEIIEKVNAFSKAFPKLIPAEIQELAGLEKTIEENRKKWSSFSTMDEIIDAKQWALREIDNSLKKLKPFVARAKEIQAWEQKIIDRLEQLIKLIDDVKKETLDFPGLIPSAIANEDKMYKDILEEVKIWRGYSDIDDIRDSKNKLLKTIEDVEEALNPIRQNAKIIKGRIENVNYQLFVLQQKVFYIREHKPYADLLSIHTNLEFLKAGIQENRSHWVNFHNLEQFQNAFAIEEKLIREKSDEIDNEIDKINKDYKNRLLSLEENVKQLVIKVDRLKQNCPVDFSNLGLERIQSELERLKQVTIGEMSGRLYALDILTLDELSQNVTVISHRVKRVEAVVSKFGQLNVAIDGLNRIIRKPFLNSDDYNLKEKLPIVAAQDLPEINIYDNDFDDLCSRLLDQARRERSDILNLRDVINTRAHSVPVTKILAIIDTARRGEIEPALATQQPLENLVNRLKSQVTDYLSLTTTRTTKVGSEDQSKLDEQEFINGCIRIVREEHAGLVESVKADEGIHKIFQSIYNQFCNLINSFLPTSYKLKLFAEPLKDAANIVQPQIAELKELAREIGKESTYAKRLRRTHQAGTEGMDVQVTKFDSSSFK